MPISSLSPWVVLTTLLVLMSTAVPAATGHTVEVKCPVCATVVEATLLLTSDSEGGVDRDMMEWSRGGVPLFLQPVTCPTCTFSADRASGFQVAVPYAVLQKLEARKMPTFEPIIPNSRERERYAEGLESRQTVPVWLRLRLLAEQMEWSSAPAVQRASAWQQVAWSTRLELNPFSGPLEQVPDEDFVRLFKRLEAPDSNQAVEEVKLGRELLQEHMGLHGEKAKRALVLGGFLLRRHGEFAELEANYSSIESILGPRFRRDLSQSVAHERLFLKLSLVVLEEEMLPSPGPDDPPPPVLDYLAGEMHRRLGQSVEARQFYQRALSAQDLPAELRPWVEDQLMLVVR